MNTTKILRHINAARCLRLLYDGRSMSRADIARELGLTRATIGHAINFLDDEGYILEGELFSPEGRKGRPGVAVMLNPMGAYFVGVDVGTRVLSAVVIDLRMNLVSRIVEPTGPRFRDAENIVDRIQVLVRRVVAEAGISSEKIEGLCVSVPGIVARNGSVVNAPFLEWRDYPLRQRLIELFSTEWMIVVCNDAFAFANAEASSLAVSDGSILLVLMAEGIGGAVIDGGQPLSGAHGYSGEIGHMVIAVGDRTDSFEMLAGAKSFERLVSQDTTVAEGVAEMLANPDAPDVKIALDNWAEALATGFANSVHLLDCGKIVIGGPMSALLPLVADSVRDRLERKLLAGFGAPVISVAKHGPDGAAIGAAATIREALFSLPEFS